MLETGGSTVSSFSFLSLSFLVCLAQLEVKDVTDGKKVKSRGNSTANSFGFTSDYGE